MNTPSINPGADSRPTKSWDFSLALSGATLGFYADMTCISWPVFTTVGAVGGAFVGLLAKNYFREETRLATACWALVQILLAVSFTVLAVTIAVIFALAK